MGRKPDTDIAMTGTERQKRLRQRCKPQSKAAEYLSIVYGTWRKHRSMYPDRPCRVRDSRAR